ncbi:hypothetical protein JB92DRAFT_2945839 [Gautieria morchelliformis]|nr:hypothetical protein JB92DRAFT_2945839 [Gautieria morchelliformis]
MVPHLRRESPKRRQPDSDDADPSSDSDDGSASSDSSSHEDPRRKRGLGPAHAIVIPELERDREDLATWSIKGRLVIRKLVADANTPETCGVRIPAKIKQMACTIQGFLPEAALTSREVSRAFLTTRHGNLMCQLHGKFAKKRVNIPEGSQGYWITGMDINGRSMGKTSKQAVPRGEGFCHCGCDEDAVLFEFAMWKRWRVLVPGNAPGAYLAESLRGQVMDPDCTYLSRLRMSGTQAWD